MSLKLKLKKSRNWSCWRHFLFKAIGGPRGQKHVKLTKMLLASYFRNFKLRYLDMFLIPRLPIALTSESYTSKVLYCTLLIFARYNFRGFRRYKIFFVDFIQTGGRDLKICPKTLILCTVSSIISQVFFGKISRYLIFADFVDTKIYYYILFLLNRYTFKASHIYIWAY